MAPIKTRPNENQKETAPLLTVSAVTSGEKQVLYSAFTHGKKKNPATLRTARLVLLAAAFGFLAAVCAIRLFPM
ncbi:MAG: hypothetical protein WAM73_17720 [Desulfobacterales bacterium]